MKTKPLEPWRIIKGEGCFQVWTRFDDTPGSRNNYIIADGIQSEEEANRICDACSPLAPEPNMDAIKTNEINVLVKENNELRQRMATARDLLMPLGQQANENPSVLAIREALRILR